MEYAARIQRVMVRREKIDGDRDAGHCLACFENCSSVDLVRLKDVAGYNNELALFLLRNAAQISNTFISRLCPARLRIIVQKLPGNTELPVTRVHESGLHDFSSDLVAP
jgi:hypothetical protein